MARALLRWTQEYLAIRAVVARKTIGDFESGARTLRLRTRLDITRTFEDAGVIFGEEGSARLALAGPAGVKDNGVSTDATRPINVNAGNGAYRLTHPLSRQR